jgi:hypothetical protein
MAGGVTSMQVLPGSLNAIGKVKILSAQFCTFTMSILQLAKHL